MCPTNNAIVTTRFRNVTGGVGVILIATWGEGVLGQKILLLRKKHPVVVLWNKQASAVMTKRGQWIQSRLPLSLVPFFLNVCMDPYWKA